jgi:predicted Zn finger-like uncharacterized protein
MRLICPNCDAQYEVDGSAISAEGRDVQCSNCGHGWFQLPPDLDTEDEDDTAPPRSPAPRPVPPAVKPSPASTAKSGAKHGAWDDDDDEDENTAPAPAQVKRTVAATTAKADKPAEPAQPAVQRRTVDESLLAVLREEAERETAVRRSETPRPLESQPDLGLEETTGAASAAKAVRDRLARLRGPEPESQAADKPAARRDLLPDIEEINSTLRASSENRGNEPFTSAQSKAEQVEPDTGFRSGFTLMLLVAVVLTAVYLAAPRLAEQFPAGKPALDSYVSGVDAARVWLDTAMRNAINALQGLTAGV